jgi:uncharacterized Tic20 family protein
MKLNRHLFSITVLAFLLVGMFLIAFTPAGWGKVLGFFLIGVGLLLQMVMLILNLSKSYKPDEKRAD